MNEFTLLRVCKGLKKFSVTEDEVLNLSKDISSRTLEFPQDESFKSASQFLSSTAQHFILDKNFFVRAYPEGDYKYFSKSITAMLSEDEVLEKDGLYENIHNKRNRGERMRSEGSPEAPTDEDFEDAAKTAKKSQDYADFSDTETGALLNLSKGAPSGGMTTKGSIKGAIDEYERLYRAGFSTDAEILTLSRYYPQDSKLAKLAGDIIENGEPMVVGGPASVEVVDREGHLITMDAMDKAFKKFMGNIRTRNAMVLHSDVQVGWALPAYINKSGQIFKSGVYKNHLFFITEMRNDTKIAERVKEQVKEGRIRSYSIAGSALSTDSELVQEDGRDKIITKVTELELAEVTVCEQGVNQGAHFNLLKAHGSKESDSCIDGSCLITLEKEQAGPGSGVPNGGVTGGNYNKFYGAFDPDKDLPKSGELVETYSMDNTTQGSMSPGLESYSEYNEDKAKETLEDAFANNLREVVKMGTLQGSSEEKKAVKDSVKNSSLESLKRYVDGAPKSDSFDTDKGTLAEIFDTPEEILAQTERIREKYGWPKEKEALEELADMTNNPESGGTWQRGTSVTTAGEDDQTLDITKSEDCGCN